MEASSYSDDDGDNSDIMNPHVNYRRHTDHNNTNHSRDNNEGSDRGEQPRYLANLAKGRTINFYINGNIFFPSKRVVYNPKQFRDLSNYMDYLTERLEPRFGAVRKICTPKHGRRVLDLRDLQEDYAYVVAGNENFKPYRYDQISSSDRKRSPPFNYFADPVYHNRQYLSSGKIKKTETQSLLIKVWPNGGDLKGPRRVLITPRIRPYTLSTVISHVNELLKEDCVGTVEKLYFLTGTQVSDVDQIVQNGQYVACKKTEPFKRARYNEQAVKNIAMSPRLDRKLLTPLFPRSVNSTSQSSPEHSNPSTQNSLTNYPHRRKATDGDEDRIFPSKPIKYTRGSQRGHLNGFDRDHGEVFRAKDNNRNTKGAKEVADSRYTKTNLPVDQWDAQEVDDEPVTAKGAKKSGTKQQDDYRGHMTRYDASATAPQKSERQGRRPSTDKKLEEERAAAKIQAGYRGYESRKQQNALPSRTDQSHNIGDRNNTGQIHSDYQDSRQKKPTINNGNRQPVEKLPALKHENGHRGFTSNSPRESRHNPTVEKEEAAAKIQAGMRGYQDRGKLATSPAGTSSDNRNRLDEKDRAKGQVQTKAKTLKSRQPTSAREDRYDELDRENSAALTIQSHYRGYLARKTTAPTRASPRSNENYWP